MIAPTAPVNPNTELSLEESKPVVHRYFETFNQGNFQQTAGLFAEAGGLYPPFEAPVIGPEPIFNYLVTEADGMIAEPLNAEQTKLADGRYQIKIRGKVQAIAFKVPVSWRFILNHEDKIDEVHVSLLASLEELLAIRPEAAARYSE